MPVPNKPPPVYPSLQGVMDLFRGMVNAKNQAQNTDAFVLPFLNSAIQDTYSDLRVVGAPVLMRETIFQQLPVKESLDYSQQYIGIDGFFDGTGDGSTGPNFDDPALPEDFLYPNLICQRQSNTQDRFTPLYRMGSLPDPYYSYGMGAWEWRNDRIYFIGVSPQCPAMDIRLRYTAAYPDYANFNGEALDFKLTYIPIRGCLNAVSYKMAALYAFRLSPDEYPLAKQEAEEKIMKLKQEIVLNMQGEAARSGRRE